MKTQDMNHNCMLKSVRELKIKKWEKGWMNESLELFTICNTPKNNLLYTFVQIYIFKLKLLPCFCFMLLSSWALYYVMWMFSIICINEKMSRWEVFKLRWKCIILSLVAVWNKHSCSYKKISVVIYGIIIRNKHEIQMAFKKEERSKKIIFKMIFICLFVPLLHPWGEQISNFQACHTV